MRLRICKTALIAATALYLAGCAKSVKVDSSFPEPLMEKLPLSIGVYFNEKLVGYVHVEDPMMDAEWTIDIGEAQLEMFRSLFTGMFRETYQLKPDDNGSPLVPFGLELDAVIEPRLEDFEFSVPRQSGNDQYSVWIRYNIRITSPEKERISNWRVTAYGQVDEGAMGLGDESAMNEAAIIALRDAAANIATNFSSAPGVGEKLLQPGNMMFRDQPIENE